MNYPDEQDLLDAGCWFNIDKVGGLEMTAFRREARWRQHRWAVDELSIQSFGTHKGRRTHPDIPPEDISNGTKLTGADANAGANFLSPAIREVAEARMREKQDHETLDAERLRRDLLSSMPMAFNLFGEASLKENEVSRVRLAQLFGVPASGSSDIIFEWSPDRRRQVHARPHRIRRCASPRAGRLCSHGRRDRNEVPRAFGKGVSPEPSRCGSVRTLPRADGVSGRYR